ncbi:PqiB family protein [Paracoccus zhejiangensis]|uniref:Paraquat-inducible protein B n=1 Tax=Paracoccus zhejiangensis TaxID=1077935 RepID=A0A2H5F0Q3_9RHOB|nr:MlaD family protein [Paracoccus zhejiangensis]AUH65116.1 paraquat-inducible protein B [Paracoccus zhejiangensis]
MTDTPPPSGQPARPVRKTARRAVQAGVSLVWLVPILALLVTLAIAWNSYANRGRVIKVEFADATGITPGETVLKFREITVGKVEAVAFTEDLQKVVLNIRVDQDVAPYIDSDAQFWIVRPEVTAQGITRLDTVLTGAFIDGYWDAEKDEPQDRFAGLDRAPLTREDAKGTWTVLSLGNAEGVAEGTPVLFRGLEVGRLENLRLSGEDESVVADMFIQAPHDERLTSATVFWNVSGFSVSLGAKGVSLDVNSFATLIQGGVEFATLTSGGSPVEAGHVFRLQPDEDSARNSLFTGDDVGELRFTVMLDDAVNGLEQDADVKYKGLNVGRVTDLSVSVDTPEEGKQPVVRQQVTIALSPTRLGLEPDATTESVEAFIAGEVENGLRARVASAGLLGTSLMIEMVDLPDSRPATMDLAAEPYPVIPSVEGDLTDFSATAQGFLTRIGDLPIEDVLRSASDMMNSITAIASSQETRAIPGSLRTTIDEAQATLTELREVAAQLNDDEVVTSLRTALDNAAKAADAVALAAVEVPQMVEDIDAAAKAVDEFAFADISAEAQGILSDLRAMLGTEDAEQLPRNLSNTLEAASGLLNDLRDGNAAGSLNNALDSASSAADEVARAAEGLPALITRLQQTATRAESVMAAYGERSAFNAEAVSMLRELRKATAAFGSLAQMIERNPRAFILGR